jgi:acyl-CoA thioester hydrolase
VYWEDTDGGGIVYHASYLRFLERARTEWLRYLGYTQAVLAQDPGIVFAVVTLAVEYRRPARLDDALTVLCAPAVVSTASVRFDQRIERESLQGERELLVTASVKVACVNARTLRPQRLPEGLAVALAAPQNL